MINAEDLILACRKNDQLADAGVTLDSLIRDLGYEEDIEQFFHLAEQRAIRAVLLLTGRKAELEQMSRSGLKQTIAFPKHQKKLLTMFIAIFIDGVCATTRAFKEEV